MREKCIVHPGAYSTSLQTSHTQTNVITVMLVILLIVSGFTWIQYNDLQSKTTALKTQDAAIESLNQRVLELSVFEKLVNLIKSPDYSPGLYHSGVQLVSSYPMYFEYNYPNYDDSKTIMVFYTPTNGSNVSIDLFIDSVSRFPMKLTLQRGDAWKNQSWVRIGTVNEVYHTNYTDSGVVWQAPVIWSSNVSETGIYHTSQLESG